MKLKEHLEEANLMDTYIRSSKKDISYIKEDLKKLEKSIQSKDIIGILAASRGIESSAKAIKTRMESVK